MYVVMIYLFLWIKICRKLLISFTIQKPNTCWSFSVTGFAASLKPQTPFDGANYKRWRAKMVLWLTAINVYHVTQGKPEDLSSETPEGKAFEAADNLFRGAVISALAETIVDSYMMLATGKEMWDTLEAKFGGL